MSVPFVIYPTGLPAPSPGPGSIFTDGILDFSSDITPITEPKISQCDCGKPKASWPSLTRLFKLSLNWIYTSRELAESIIAEFETLGLSGFDYAFPGDEHLYRCFWVNIPEIYPVEYTELWNVKAELISVRVIEGGGS